MSHLRNLNYWVTTPKSASHAPALALLCCYIFMSQALAQDPLRGAVTMAFGDISALKQKAEAGDPQAQVALAAALEDHHHPAEALTWYRKAAKTGNMDAIYNIGRMLLFGQTGIPHSETVQANPVEGIRLTYFAATNGYHKAIGNMSGAFERGLGVSADLTQAYAWFQLFCDLEPRAPLGQHRLNELALKMDSPSIQQAKRLAMLMKQGQWPPLLVSQLPDADSRLRLNGITLGGKVQLATINGKSLAIGETMVITGKPPVTLRLVKIEKDSVLVAVEGEDAPRRLFLR